MKSGKYLAVSLATQPSKRINLSKFEFIYLKACFKLYNLTKTWSDDTQSCFEGWVVAWQGWNKVYYKIRARKW